MSSTCEKGHRVIRMSRQPCPHPECWTRGPLLTEMRPPRRAADPWGPDIRPEDIETRTSRQTYLLIEGQQVWAWVVP